MSKKKIVMSVTASAAIAAAIFGADEAEASSHKVQRGDTLWSIAQKSGTSVAQLRSINGLSSDIIYPNQVIKTASSSSSSSSSVSSSSSSGSSSSGSTYTVKRGDTLSGIASKHNISLRNLMSWNNLNTTLIYPGDKLTVSKSSSGSSSSSSSSSRSSGSKTSTGSASVYTVKAGDTLSRIASQYGVSVSNLKNWNNLSSDLILVGQKLNINGTSSSGSSSSSSSSSSAKPASVGYNVDTLVSVARAQSGTPYVWGGSSPGGFDCSGFIYYAYNQAGKNISRLSTDGYYSRSYHVSTPQVGDLVFFSGTYRSGISHMGIYVGNNQFIHAGTSTGVTVTSLDNSYWKKHFDSFKRFY